jgi:thymidine phosphorylase
MLLIEAGAGRIRPDSKVDPGVSLETRARLGDEVREGDELARIWLRREDDRLAERFADCFEVGEEGAAPELIRETIIP